MKQLAPWRARKSAMELVLVAALVIRWRNAGASHKRTRRMRDATKYRHRDCCIGQRRRRSCSILHLRHTRIDRQRRFRRPLASPSSMRSENQKMPGAVEQRQMDIYGEWLDCVSRASVTTPTNRRISACRQMPHCTTILLV